MAYSSIAQVRSVSPFKDATLINNTYVTAKIATADSIIDGSIGGAYTLPLSETPSIIENLSMNIAALLIFKEQNTNIEVEPGVTVSDKWKVEMDMLALIGKRAVKLIGSDGTELSVGLSALPQGYPNAASSDPNSPDNTSPKFEMNTKF